MYPNQQQGYNPYGPPQQQPPFGGGQAQMPMPMQGQPFGAGYPPAPYGFPGQMQNYPGQPGQPPMMNTQAPYPAPQPGANYGQQAPQPGVNYGQQAPQPGANYGQPPMVQNEYVTQQQHTPSYGAPPQQGAYSSPSIYPSLSSTPNQFGSSPQHQQHQQQQQPYGAALPPQNQYGGQQQQQAMYATIAYGQSPPMNPIKKGRPTIIPAPNFDASSDVAILRKAMKGFGTDEDALINVLCHRTNDQRIQIVRTFKTAYGKDLLDEIRSETSGNFQNVLIALCTPTAELYCRELYEAMVGVGTDEDVLIEVMCTMSNHEIRTICAWYARMFGKPLEQHLRSETSGCMKRLMTSLSVGGRDESMMTDINQAKADAQALKTAGIGRMGTDESEFNRILCLRNYEQLKLICQEYQNLTGHPLEKDIKKEFSGDIEEALLAIVRVATNRAEFFARRLHKSMAGLGTDDRALIRLCVTRAEIDMMDIKDEFLRYYKKSLKSFIKGDTSGHYKHALYALCGENRS